MAVTLVTQLQLAKSFKEHVSYNVIGLTFDLKIIMNAITHYLYVMLPVPNRT